MSDDDYRGRFEIDGDRAAVTAERLWKHLRPQRRDKAVSIRYARSERD